MESTISRPKQTKINQILQKLPKSVVATSQWLNQEGLDKRSAYKYEKQSNWLESIGIGAYKRYGDAITWQGGIHAIQKQLGLDIHVGAKTALELQGKAHNISPRDAYFTLAIDPTKHKTVIDALLNKWTTSWRSHLNKDDQALEVKGQVLNTPVPSKGIKEVEWRRIFSGISLFPHGPHSFIKDGGEKLKDLVQASSNLAKLIIMNEQLYIQTSIRSFRNFERDLLIQKMRAFAQVLNFSLKEGVGYPGWAPNFEHPINRYARKVYQDLFKEDLEFKAIHAGLECGLLLEKYPHLKAISIGPTIKGAHSPDERVHIPSVTEFWKFLTTMLKNIDQLA